ncbi:MAG: 1-acyl-sn-glycerol-3-phosphate acyltransferase [Muribaculaceae bacterium]|nr:1-acyl-sn-glycerol-3-phosphate acyltransferase [Muribaculaceae bacterium]
MNISKLILRIVGWQVKVTVPDYPKCIICVAPHTSNWDFILGKLAYASIGRKAGFLMKESWFFWPLGCFFRAIGGIPVPRQRGSALSAEIIDRFRHAQRMALAITPEGTRSLTSQWRSGFLHIAIEAEIPVILGVIDYRDKQIYLTHEFHPTGDIDSDMHAIKEYYRPYHGKYPEKFTTD